MDSVLYFNVRMSEFYNANNLHLVKMDKITSAPWTFLQILTFFTRNVLFYRSDRRLHKNISLIIYRTAVSDMVGGKWAVL